MFETMKHSNLKIYAQAVTGAKMRFVADICVIDQEGFASGG